MTENRGNKVKSRVPRAQSKRDPAKEGRLNELVCDFVKLGFVVRREELKRGLGWRATSGVCRVFDRDTIFVDKRLGIDDQISFLESRLDELRKGGLGEAPESVSAKPESGGLAT
jgi:hypothetical protein